MTEEQLTALLHLKRHELPPPQYFDRLLRDVQQRQRTELLRRPLWKIAIERVQTFFGEHSMGHVSYAGAMASVLVVGVALIGTFTSPKNSENQNGNLAGGPQKQVIARAPDQPVSLALTSGPAPSLGSPQVQTVPVSAPSIVRQPRYVIDARPVSYEPTSSFNF